MTICFVIQPFDNGRFDKRYADVFRPAIVAAGLTPYRVDEDANAEIPIESIESKIRSSLVCLADITMDNPNVWYELGFAFASGRPVVMVCSDERPGGRYPFDIQHRTIIRYQNESSSDFETLRTRITERIAAAKNKADAMAAIADNQNILPIQGLTQPELIVLASIAASLVVPEGSESVWTVRNDTEKAGLTTIAFQIGLRRLKAKGLVEDREVRGHYDDEAMLGVGITESGWEWIDVNEEKFVIKRGRPKASNVRRLTDSEDPFPDDDIPF